MQSGVHGRLRPCKIPIVQLPMMWWQVQVQVPSRTIVIKFTGITDHRWKGKHITTVCYTMCWYIARFKWRKIQNVQCQNTRCEQDASKTWAVESDKLCYIDNWFIGYISPEIPQKALSQVLFDFCWLMSDSWDLWKLHICQLGHVEDHMKYFYKIL